MPTSYKEQYHGYIRHKRLIIFLFALLLLVLVIVSITLGTADLSPLDVLAALVGQGSVHDLIVVWNLRMPRVPVSYTHLDVYKRQLLFFIPVAT